MTKCKYCGYRNESFPEGYTRLFCDDCIKEKEIGNIPFYAKETIHLRDGYKTSKARIDELERRVILPYSRGTNEYYLGRKGENGKIQEKEPNYYP